MDRRRFFAALAGGLATVAAGPSRAEMPSLRFRDLYGRGRQLSDMAQGMVGQRITMTGYMAPPLKPEVHFFVLTRMPMATCPFCNDAADWPDDIVLAFMDGPFEFTRYSNLIRVEGRFDTGMHRDEDTGFVSMVRLLDSRYARL